MSPDREHGINISIREMYDLMQKMADNLTHLRTDMELIKHRVNVADMADERSREAKELAEDAWQQIENMESKIEKVERRFDGKIEKLERRMEEKDQQTYSTREKIAVGLMLAVATSALGAVFYFAQMGVLGG